MGPIQGKVPAARRRVKKVLTFFKQTGGDSSGSGQEFSPDGVRRTSIRCSLKTIAKKRREWQKFVGQILPCTDTFRGRGIVTCAGGKSYFTCAWVNISMLRKKGCSLPVELWHQENELNAEAIEELKKLNVVCRNFSDYTSQKVCNAYQLKPIALLHSSFREILYLDADNNCLMDPSFLFNSTQYQENGALFWPDYWMTSPDNPVWKIVNRKESCSPEQESGQLLIDKEKCWRELNLCWFFNSDPFYYKILWGDKDTFRFAWMALNRPFYMINKGVGAVGFQDVPYGFHSIAMLQHDCQGSPLFVHSNLLKWDARQDGRRLWKEVRRLKPETKEKRIEMRYHPEYKKFFLTIEGMTETVTEEHSIARLERESLQVLRELRSSAFYKNFSAFISTPV